MLWIFETILAWINKETALISALRRGDLDGARALIEAGADLLEPDGSGTTALDIIYQQELNTLKRLAQRLLPAKISKGAETKHGNTKSNPAYSLKIKLPLPQINWPDFDSRDIPSKSMAGRSREPLSNLNGPSSLTADKDGTEFRPAFGTTQDQTISAEVLTNVTVREPKQQVTEETLFDSLNELADDAPQDLEFEPSTSLKASETDFYTEQIDKATRQIALLAEVN